MVDAFLAAPVPNPDGTTGIRLHVQIDETNIPFVANWANGFREFDAIKGNQTPNVAGGFGTRTERAGTNWAALRAAKAQVYRYAIFANTFGTTGAGGQSEYPGNDFMITLGTGNSTINQAACFMHELGHALGLHHGGDTGVNFKPNYRSIMNYALTYARTPIESSFVLDYSRQSLPTLNEGRLNESVGVGDASTLPGTNQPYQMVLGSIGGITGQLINLSGRVDWSRSDANSDGVADNDPNVRADINRDGRFEVLTGYDDWSHLHYRLRDGSDFADGSHVNAEPENARLLQAYLSLEVRQTPGKITGLKWWDSNGDGRLALTEPRMEAWSIYLDLNRNGWLDAGEPVTQSGATGEYQFNNVEPGVYDVREVMKPEWQQTFPGGLESHVVVVDPGQTTQGVNFGNARLGEIHGAKWHDVNANGVWDSNEPGMDGWVIYLDANRNGLRDPDERWTRTGNRGAYLFVGVPQGTWTVAEEMQSNWCQTYPGTPDVHVVALKAEQKLEGINFGNARWASIEGNVWDDANADGRRDRGEQPLEGWQVFADANGNGTVDRGESSALSDPQGHYTLRVKPGTTTVRMLTQRGWKVSSPAHNSHTLALTSGLAVSGLDFGCVQERPVNEAVLQKQFDFGTPRSPVGAGYSPVTERTKYATTLGYGWAAGKISSADRRSGNALDRDLTLTSKGTFVVDVPAGTYVVDLRIGDRGRYAHDLMGFSLEGIPVDPITTAAYQAEERSYLVHVVNGQLTIDLYDLGGSDRSVAIAGLTITTLPTEAVPRTRPLTVTMNQAAGQFDPSPNSEAVFDVAFSEPVSGFTLADVLFSGLPAGSSASVTGRGTNYHVVVSGLTGQGTVTASVPAGVVTGLSGRANAASTSDDNSVRFLSPLVQFDFGTSRSSVEAGFRPVNERTAYTTTLGYGWAAGRISSVARGTGSALDRDLNSTSQGTFVIDVCNGTYLVDVRFGDTGRVAHDWMAISVEGSQRDVVSTAATQMVWRRYEVVVTDGQLTLGLTDQGGKDKSVVIAGLMLTPASTPNVLADSLRAASPLVPWSSAVDAVLARGLE